MLPRGSIFAVSAVSYHYTPDITKKALLSKCFYLVTPGGIEPPFSP